MPFFRQLDYLTGALVIAHQMLVPHPAQRLVDVKDVPLPSGLASNAQQAKSLTPGAEVQNGFDLLQIDNFDFQAYDAATHRLFIAHTGPNPDDMNLKHISFDAKYDGHILVFDTNLDRVIAR